MRLQWSEIGDYYVYACGNATAAIDEKYAHLNAALQWLCDQVDVHELLANTTRDCTVGRDYVELPPEAYSIYSVTDQTQKYRLDPEPGGMRGRTRYLVDNGQPVSGSPRYYALLGTKLYLRDMPNAADTLLIYYKKQPTKISEGDLSLYPIVPDQYHWPLVWYAAANYYSLHPEGSPDAPGTSPRGANLMQQAMAGIGMPPTQKQQQDTDRREWTRLAGYSVNVSGR